MHVNWTSKKLIFLAASVYSEAYPEPANQTKSILLFGAVAKERHATGTDGERDEHHHMTAYTSKRHYWSKVAKLSYENYQVKLNAVAHDGYFTMFRYIKQHSAHKPLSELDQEVYLSPLHPRGEALTKLLEVGATFAHARSQKRKSSEASRIGGNTTRFRAADIYDLVTTKNIQSVIELQALAFECVEDGDKRLAKFCTTAGTDKLEQLIQSANEVMRAPSVLALRRSTRLDLLYKASVSLPCVCNGIWIPGAMRVLDNNNEDIAVFCRDVRRALDVGCKRGTNIAIIGEPGCCKSMLFEPFDGIFDVMGKPESKSSFPLAGVLDAQVLLWQDWKHNDATILFEDILSLIVGERMAIRCPFKKNVSFRNTSPLFYTSNSPLYVARHNFEEMARLNAAMSERFCTRTWLIPFPKTDRIADFPRCSCCCAKFFLSF